MTLFLTVAAVIFVLTFVTDTIADRRKYNLEMAKLQWQFREQETSLTRYNREDL